MTERPGNSLPDRAVADQRPVVFALHFLGGSAAAWTPLIERTAGQLSWRPLDLPGFGDAGAGAGYSVAAMAETMAGHIRRAAPRRWILAGHSMGAKVACVLARMAEDGAEGLEGLSHVILLAGSPPGPEPMTEEKRQVMLGWFAGDDASSRVEAQAYIRDNVEAPLPPALHAGALGDVLRATRGAWVAWLTDGSREDWSTRIGVLRTPALIVSGDADEALGHAAQASLMAPHFASPRLAALPNASHLLPLEAPDALADLIAGFLDEVPEPTIGRDYRDLIGSNRVSERTRRVLLDRAEPVPAPASGLTEHQMSLLRALVDRIIPQKGRRRIDLAARMVAAMETGPGDGWRFAELPSDDAALRAGLRALDATARMETGRGFVSLDPDQQDALLRSVATNERAPTGRQAADGGLSGQQMRLWFADMCSAATQIYMAHPATQERIGYSGIANRGDGSGPQGFVALGLGQREAWEPAAHAVTAR